MYRRERLEKERLVKELECVMQTMNRSLQLPPSLYIGASQLSAHPLGSILGHGSYGECTLETFRGMTVTVKRFKHDGLDNRRVRHEVLKEATALLHLKASNHLPYLIGASFDEIPYKLITSFHGIDFISTTICSVLSGKTPQISEIDWKTVVEQVCKGLNEIHCCGFIHNDLKYDNVIIEETAGSINIVIIDFGKSCRKGKAQKKTMSIADQALYKERYPWVAPEVVAGTATPSTASDVYSVGYLVRKILSAHKQRGLTLANAVELKTIIQKCTEVDVADRPSVPRILDLIDRVV
ncbi:probable serine/threonine-protein kinase DDB_G0267514 [Lineus longissimus]|uniref:probable serine/threonine-protein kinase DDB_G0267514 n=1 Tax=Lineus longissimus TaxID=88925 RepID=UPI00315CE752